MSYDEESIELEGMDQVQAIQEDTPQYNVPEVSFAIPPIPRNCKRLFLVQHGEVATSSDEQLYGIDGVPLSESGKQEALAAAEFLQGINLHRVYSSPKSCTLYGANQIMRLQERLFKQETLFKKVQIDQGFFELGEEVTEKQALLNEIQGMYPVEMKTIMASRDALLESTDLGRASCLVAHLKVVRYILL